MGKWLAGILGTVIAGALLWLLTDALFPRLLHKEAIPVADDVRVECIPTPATIAPGETTELTVRVTRNGAPVEGAAVYFKPEEAQNPIRTVSGGMIRVPWKAPNPSASAYVFGVNVNLDGIRTAQGELSGSYGTDCEVMVR